MTPERIAEVKDLIKRGCISVRSCWNCNEAHEYLKDRDYVIVCMWCESMYFKGERTTLEELHDPDPTPWCIGCGAMKEADCTCGPIADNE